MDGKKFNLKNLLLSKLSRKITILFMIVGVIVPLFAVYYFYIIIINVAPETLTSETIMLLRNSVILIVIIVTINAGLIGFLFSKSIIKSLKKLYNATKEIEKGNFNVHLEIFTRDEIQDLADAFNQTVSTLAKIHEESKEIDNAKNEFLSITSHELRNPMTPMKAQLQMLEKNYFGKLSNKQKESIMIITRNADRLDRIIADFLEVSRIETARLKFNFREIDIAKVIKEIVQFMDGLAKEKNIKLELNIEKLPIIEADPDRISQVLRNLINNAIKFSNERSKIEISAKLKNNQILFSVKDYGCGLTPDDQIRIFEPFYQVEGTNHHRHDGTGLGLAICRGIVESQKGKIWVESKPEAGSKFYFTLPLCPVREIEPIKVLFSQKGVIEKKIRKEFQTYLGPLGIGEFKELKSKNLITKDDLFQYIDFLIKNYILPQDQGLNFKNKIGKIFGDENLRYLKKKNEFKVIVHEDYSLKKT